MRIEGFATCNFAQTGALPISDKRISDLRRRMLEDMAVRQFGEKTKHDYIRHIESFAKFLGRSPDTATAEDVRRFQVHLTERGVQPPTLNGSASALRFFFGTTLDRVELARHLARVHYPRKLPRVLSPEEVGRLLEATMGGLGSGRPSSGAPTCEGCLNIDLAWLRRRGMLQPGRYSTITWSQFGASFHTAGLAWPCDTPRLPTSVPKQTREHVECVLKEPRRPLAPLAP